MNLNQTFDSLEASPVDTLLLDWIFTSLITPVVTLVSAATGSSYGTKK